MVGVNGTILVWLERISEEMLAIGGLFKQVMLVFFSCRSYDYRNNVHLS